MSEIVEVPFVGGVLHGKTRAFTEPLPLRMKAPLLNRTVLHDYLKVPPNPVEVVEHTFDVYRLHKLEGGPQDGAFRYVLEETP